MPAELDELTRRVMRLEIEEAALAKETDPASKARLDELRRELADLRAEADAKRAQWEAERQAIRRVQELRAELEQVAARGRGGRARLRPQPGRRAALRPARRAGAAAARPRRSGWPPSRAGNRLLREVVTEEEIAEIVSRVDRHPGGPAAGGRAGEAAAARRDPARAGRRPGRGGAAGRRRDHPGPVRHQGPAPADRVVHLPRTDRRRQDRAGQDAGRGAVRQRGQHGPPRHERVPGAAHRQPAGRRAARLRRLRGGRPAHRGGAPQAVLGRAVRRDREGARRRLQHPAAGARRRPAHRRAGPHGRLPQHGHHHDLEHRLAVPARRASPPTARSSRTRATG